MKVALHGFVFLFSIFISALVAAVVFIGPFALLPLPRRWYHKFVDYIKSFWFAQNVYLLENWCGTKFVMSGDVSSISQALVISNHRTRLDWMYLWAYFLRVNALANLRILLKAELGRLPVFGWGMQGMLFAFLERDWAKDEAYLLRLFRYIRGLRLPSSYLLFPEGTDLSEHRLNLSHAFADKAGLPKYQYVLHPRVKGFHCCVQEVRPDLECVVDITMGYVDFVPNERPSEASLVGARYPKEVHIHVTKHALGTIPTDEAGVEEWLKARFAEKEVRLKKFYEGSHSFGTAVPAPASSIHPGAFGNYVLICLCILSGWAFVYFWWFRWFFCLSVVAWVLVTARGGLDRLELGLFAQPDKSGKSS